jgi:ELWxxDGT repeat protein
MLLIVATMAQAGSPAPVLVDINTGNGPVADSSPSGFARLTATVTVFTAWDPVHGRELWITDGTTANTRILADICPGACSSSATVLNAEDALARGVAYLAADDGRLGNELWRATADGDVSMVADINPGALGSDPGTLVFPNQTMTMPGYFAATATATGRELYRTGGTADDTFLVKDIIPGPEGSSPLEMGAGRVRVYFSAIVPGEGYELYDSDGTADDTRVRAIIRPGPQGSFPRNFVQWQNDEVLFTAHDGVHGRELWLTTPSVTELLADIAPGSAGSNPGRATAFGGRVFFTADDGTHGNEVWSTDATPDGTELFVDLRNDIDGDSSFPDGLAVLNAASGARLLFIAQPDGSSTRRLYTSDGTIDGTVPIAPTGQSPSSPNGFTINGAFAYFIDSDIRANAVWRTDGSDDGTIEIHNFSDDFPDPEIRLGGAVGASKTLLSLTSPSIGEEPYVVDSGSGSDELLANIAPDLGYGDPRDLTDVEGTLYFSAFAEGVGRELWKATGPAQGAELVADLVPGAEWSDPEQLRALGDKLLFVVVPGELFVSDGGAAGTFALVPTDTGAPLFDTRCLAVVGNRAYFYATSDGDGGEPWVSDGSPAGTHRIDVQPGSDAGEGHCDKGEPAFAAAGANVLFDATDETHGEEPFRSAGTAPALVRDINPGGFGSYPRDFGAFGMRACFEATTPDEGAEPWCSDGTGQGTAPLGDLLEGGSTSQPRQFTGIGDWLVFSATAATGRTLWRSDGSAAGTEPVASVGSSLIGFPPLGPGDSDVRVPLLSHVGNAVYFPCPALDLEFCIVDVRPGHGPVFVAGYPDALGGTDDLRAFSSGDVLMSCATEDAGREPCLYSSIEEDIAATIVDIAPGAASSSPREFTVSDHRIWFSADDGTHGRELWSVALEDTIERIFADGFE